MVFSSYIFLFVFLPGVLLAYYSVPRRFRNGVLLVSSFVFYGWASPLFLAVLIVTILVCFYSGRLMERSALSVWRRVGLFVGVIFPLLNLGFFKYFNFARDNWNWILNTWGVGFAQLDLALQVVLPLGISFYTFQAISYVVDLHRGKARPQAHLVDFATYISLFPQLVAGPIIRYTEIEEQLWLRRESVKRFCRGVGFFGLGFGKKIVLANPCGQVADVVFSSAGPSMVDAWIGVFAYTMQIYFDFSGYSDMAIGLGLMFGFVFPKNFSAPYRSSSITEFWRRWHISLSTFLKDYLYVPLGGNRRGKLRTYFNLSIVMLIGGLWHGASWNFVLWGGAHGLFLSIERFFRRGLFRGLGGVVFTFVLVSLLWVLFRTDDLHQAGVLYASLFGFGGTPPAESILRGWILQFEGVAVLILCFGIVWFAPTTHGFMEHLSLKKAVWVVAVFFVALVVMVNQDANPFIYFNF